MIWQNCAVRDNDQHTLIRGRSAHGRIRALSHRPDYHRLVGSGFTSIRELTSRMPSSRIAATLAELEIQLPRPSVQDHRRHRRSHHGSLRPPPPLRQPLHPTSRVSGLAGAVHSGSALAYHHHHPSAPLITYCPKPGQYERNSNRQATENTDFPDHFRDLAAARMMASWTSCQDAFSNGGAVPPPWGPQSG